MKQAIDKFIINKPHEGPNRHWFCERESSNFYIRDGRRPAGYVITTEHTEYTEKKDKE